MRPRRAINPKRRLSPAPADAETAERLRLLAGQASYGGNPSHKRNPGDFGLNPPATPRQGKTLCDDARIFHRRDAVTLLKLAFERGLVSEQWRDGWPQNVWAVTTHGVAVEGILENPATGAYHGYPMLPIDPLTQDVLARWEQQP